MSNTCLQCGGKVQPSDDGKKTVHVGEEDWTETPHPVVLSYEEPA